MDYDIKDIKRIRLQAELTQSELAERSGVSQSLIAKIESGVIDTSYSNIKKIFGTLDSLKSRHEPLAKDLMKKSVITINSSTTVKQAIDKMRKNAISQIPVMDEGIVVGLISESDLLEVISEGKNVPNVSSIMKDAPPLVSETASAKVVINLLKFYSIILVGDKGKFKGVIAKADILDKMY